MNAEEKVHEIKIKTIELDRSIGKIIRLRRVQLGITQQVLAAKMGLSYQQIQKYETGTNRCSAGRLTYIAKILKKPISFFTQVQDIEPESVTKRAKKMDRVFHLRKVEKDVRQPLSDFIEAIKEYAPVRKASDRE